MTLDQKLIAQQTKMETEALTHVTRALEVAIAWEVDGADLSRKLSSVRFATELFLRQVERLFALEELDGYMEAVCRLHPELVAQVDVMKLEHHELQVSVRRVALRLDRVSPTDLQTLDAICDELRGAMRQVLEHNDRESTMFIESVLRDTGGQG